MNKIISRFYLITIDNKPVYVGYTNRTIKQRFREHIKDKDLPEESEIKQIDKLEFEFTWDIVQVNENAKLVSDRESELITEYSTGNSPYQKGPSGMKGGQTWASVKGFVNSNRNNPQYIGMGSEELLEYLDSYHNYMDKLHRFIIHYQDYRLTKLSNFISGYRDIRFNKLSNFVSNYKDPRMSKLSSFVRNYCDPRLSKLSHFIGHYNDTRLDKLSGFVKNYKDPRTQKLSNFIVRYRDPRLDKLHNFIIHYKNQGLTPHDSLL